MLSRDARKAKSCLQVAVANPGFLARLARLRWIGRGPDFLESCQTGDYLSEGGDPIEVNDSIFDITERSDLEHRMQQCRRIEAAARLTGTIAHDFNNILTAIIAYSQLMLKDLKEGEHLYYEASQILTAAQRAAELMGRLVTFSSKRVVQPVMCDMNACVADVASLLRPTIREDVELITVLDPELGRVEADPVQLQRVIMNLVANARDAMTGPGRITIQTENVCRPDGPEHQPIPAPRGPHIMMAVTDTGCGMDRETQSRVFEPFFTTKEMGKGTGLGLSTVYGIVKQSGGSISVHSEPGHGATFRIYFPRSGKEAGLQAEPDPG